MNLLDLNCNYNDIRYEVNHFKSAYKQMQKQTKNATKPYTPNDFANDIVLGLTNCSEDYDCDFDNDDNGDDTDYFGDVEAALGDHNIDETKISETTITPSEAKNIVSEAIGLNYVSSDDLIGNPTID